MIKLSGLTSAFVNEDEGLYGGDELFETLRDSIIELQDSDLIQNIKYNLLKLENEYKVSGKHLAGGKLRMVAKRLQDKFDFDEIITELEDDYMKRGK